MAEQEGAGAGPDVRHDEFMDEDDPHRRVQAMKIQTRTAHRILSQLRRSWRS